MNYSYSRLSMFDRCPNKFRYRYIEKFVINDDSAVFEKGRYLHLLLEHYPVLPEYEFQFLSNEGKKMEYIQMISNLCQHERKIKYLLSNALYREKQFYLDPELNNCEEDEQKINGAIDYVGKVNETVILCDWKSGMTQKYASFEQLKLYSIWAFNEFSDINNIVAFLYFIEQNLYVRLDISRSESDVIKQSILSKINIIESTTEYNKIKKEDCQYCCYFKDCNPYKVRI